ncbi:MAG: PA2778 family cysteine peptidase [Burkholderiaceae bacterium]
MTCRTVDVRGDTRRRLAPLTPLLLATTLLLVLLGGCAAPQSAALREAWRAAGAGAAAAGADVDSGAAAQPGAGVRSTDVRSTDVRSTDVRSTDVRLAAPFPLPPVARLDDVPFVAQTEYQCGPATLAMLMRRLGRDVTLDELSQAVYVPARQGSLAAEMLALPRRHGLLPMRAATSLQPLLQTVAQGRPVIVFQNLGLSALPVWHYAVLVGYDLPANRVWLHSGTSPMLAMSLDTFERTWARSGYWAMTVSEPDAPPPDAEPLSVVQAAAALERLDRSAALRTYDALLSRRPDDRLALLARANALYADGRPTQAVAAYQRLVQAHPDAADGWNNLAQALAELGRLDEARRAVQRALALGGPRLPVYQQTAAQLGAAQLGSSRSKAPAR